MTSATLTMIGKLGGDMFKSMKIPVENNLDEIVAELENREYVKDTTLNDCACYVYTTDEGSYFIYMGGGYGDDNLTTLAELKRMKLVELKEM